MKDHKITLSALEELKTDCTRKQKRGLHFILASVVIWLAIFIIHQSALPISAKNLYTFFCSAPLVPLAYFISRFIGVDFQNKDNPLSNLGLLFTVNQILYILIAMWIYAASPEKMLMVYAMIFGAHLLPFGWLYRSKAYYVLSVFVPIGSLILGLCFSSVSVAVFMFITEVVFCCCLVIENKADKQRESNLLS